MTNNGKGKRFFTFLWRLVSVNFFYKIFALLLAALSWYLIQGREIIEINRQLNVTINVPDGYGVKGSACSAKMLLSEGHGRILPVLITLPLKLSAYRAQKQWQLSCASQQRTCAQLERTGQLDRA